MFNFIDDKAIYRQRAKLVRDEVFKNRPEAPRHAARHFIDAIPLNAGQIIALYHATSSEMNTGPLATALHEKAIRLALPVVVSKKQPLIFRAFDGNALVEGAFGIMTPPEIAPEVTPDMIVVPLLAFKQNGARLGMGGGFYDRTLAALHKDRALLTVGFAFADQQDEKFPVEKHDQCLDWVVTERAAIRCR